MRPIVTVIAAQALDGTIGIDNKLPWHLPDELKFFKEVTMGCPVIMGRKTWESIGRPLPGRRNIVISNTLKFLETAVVVPNLEAGIQAAGEVDEVFIIGGEQVYEDAIEICDRMYVTTVDCEPDGDAIFPYIDTKWVWTETEICRHEADDRHSHSFTIYEYVRDFSDVIEFLADFIKRAK